MWEWHGSSGKYNWPCGVENVLVMDEEVGEQLKLMDLEFKYDRIMEAQSREQGDNLLFLKGGCIYDNDMEAREVRSAMFTERGL